MNLYIKNSTPKGEKISTQSLVAHAVRTCRELLCDRDKVLILEEV